MLSRLSRFHHIPPSLSRLSAGSGVLQIRTSMVSDNEVLQRMGKRADQAEELVELLKGHLQCLQKAAEKVQSPSSQAQVESLKKENEKLKAEATKLKKELEYWEIRNGVQQVALPSSGKGATPQQAAPVAALPTIPPPTTAPEPAKNQPAQDKKKEKKSEKKPKTEKPKKDEKNSGAADISVSRLNFMVGKIQSIKKHPDADSLFVEEIDVGEAAPRTICSGLNGHIEMSSLQDAMVVILANLKPVKMRGIFSQGMVMCCNRDDKWTVVVPPEGSAPGDRVVFDGQEGEPDAQLNPKKKVWETLAPDFKTNSEGQPCFRDLPFTVRGKGVCASGGIIDGVVR